MTDVGETARGAEAAPRETLHRLREHERRLEEALDLFDRWVDPREAFDGDDGEPWLPTLDARGTLAHAASAYRTEDDLRRLREESRRLSIDNEFAINAFENRVSYVVGWGHAYTVVAHDERDAPLAVEVDRVLDEFRRVNQWRRRQQEILRRKDRDGECFLRFFPGDDGVLRVRFVEPEHVGTPSELASDPCVRLGVRHATGDVETRTHYYVRESETKFVAVPASRMQHRRESVDCTAPRGVPLLQPVRPNLLRAAKILRNMSTVSEIQAAIALIRQHASGTRATIQELVRQTSDRERTRDGKVQSFKKYPPGAIIDAPANVNYQFPAQAIQVDRFVAALQAELRAVASRLVMPEFMLTSDASQSNYASTLVAEGPAVKMFERLQQDQIDDDLEVFEAAVRTAELAGRLPPGSLARVSIHAEPPSVRARDALQEVQADKLLAELGWLSPQTGASRHGLEYARERANLRRVMNEAGGE